MLLAADALRVGPAPAACWEGREPERKGAGNWTAQEGYGSSSVTLTSCLFPQLRARRVVSPGGA